MIETDKFMASIQGAAENNSPNRILSGQPQNVQDGQSQRNFQQFQNISGAGTLPVNPVYSQTAKFNQLGGTNEIDPTTGQPIQMT